MEQSTITLIIILGVVVLLLLVPIYSVTIDCGQKQYVGLESGYSGLVNTTYFTKDATGKDIGTVEWDTLSSVWCIIK